MTTPKIGSGETSAPPAQPTERLWLMARFGARIAHENLFDCTINIDGDPTEGHENHGGPSWGFDTCPHGDCAMVRLASSRLDAPRLPDVIGERSMAAFRAEHANDAPVHPHEMVRYSQLDLDKATKPLDVEIERLKAHLDAGAPQPHVDQAGDVCCEHGTAMDVHCCGCHSGFLFDSSKCTCF